MNYNTILPPFKWFVLQNFPYIEDDFDALTNWQLFCKLGKEMNKIIEKCNLTGEQVENLTNAYNELKAYVDDYFENLDIQEEVNIKLDEMAQSGELAELISQYLESQAIIGFNTNSSLASATNLANGSFARTYGKEIYNDGKGAFYKIRTRTNADVPDGDNIIALTNTENLVAEKIIDYNLATIEERTTYTFDTVADMKDSSVLQDGYFAQTLGFYAKNDGGNAKYKIRTATELDTIDDSTIIQIGEGDLIAELIIEDSMCVDAFGCKGDGIEDDTEKMQIALNNSLNLRLNMKNYKVTETLTFRNNTKLVGLGVASKISSIIDDGSAILYNNDSVAHFIFEDFQIDATNKNAKGFVIVNPYDNCVIRNLYLDNFSNSAIDCGDNSAISQTLLIDNCTIYTTAQNNNFPLISLTKCYESNITNNKLLNRIGYYNASPCLLLTNSIDGNIQGNSFTCTSDCAIKITGTECRYNRIISNTYEDISGTDVIKLVGTTSDAILDTLIIESGAYYNAPKSVSTTNTAQTFVIGLAVSGGRRNMCININSGNVQDPYGNGNMICDGGAWTSRAWGISGANGQKLYTIIPNDSLTADYGLDLSKKGTAYKFTLDFGSNYYGSNKSGMRIMMKQPDGTTKYVGLNNSGQLTVYSSPS